MRDENANLIIWLSAFRVGGKEKPLEHFLDDADSTWYSLGRYGEENNLKTEQIFLIEGKKIIQKEKNGTLFTFFPAGEPFSKLFYPIYYLRLLNYLLKKKRNITILQLDHFNAASYL